MSGLQPEFDIERVIAVAQRAGELVLQMQRDGLRAAKSKSTAIDIVTEADIASEQLIRAALHELYPTVGFWGEESNQQPSEEYFWLVDPIDGTTNYANGLPIFAVNIALHRQEIGLLGVTVQLPSGNVYWAEQGKGAYLREVGGVQRRLAVSQVSELKQALLTTGFPYHRAVSPDNNTAEFIHFVQQAQGVRCMGSAALDLAYVASGALAAFWEGWLNPWDAAPGALLIREAGGQVTDYTGTPWTLTSRSLIASNGQPALHNALMAGIHTARQGLAESRL